MFVYFIQCGHEKNPPIKVGVAKNIERRIKSMQTGNPFELKLLCFIECANAKEAYNLEGFIHSELKNRKIRGEWFATCMRRVNKIVSKWYTEKEVDFSKFSDRVDEELDRQIMFNDRI